MEDQKGPQRAKPGEKLDASFAAANISYYIHKEKQSQNDDPTCESEPGLWADPVLADEEQLKLN